MDPQYAPARTRLADAYLEIGNAEQAKDELRVANQLAGKRSLATNDQLHLDAVNAIADRDFPGAISSYQKILDQAPAAEKANAFVEVYECNNNESFDTLEDSYDETTHDLIVALADCIEDRQVVRTLTKRI